MGQIHLLVYTGAAANFTLQTSGGPISRGGGHPDPDIREARLKKKFFRPFGPHFGLKLRRGPGPPRAPPLHPPLQTRFHT